MCGAYRAPELMDLGLLAQLTQATGYSGGEDGAVKDPMEALPTRDASAPAGP